ncbi:MAG TPA: hypothetical protein VIH59_00060 [Candidatus Tectomicrobia bacterium]
MTLHADALLDNPIFHATMLSPGYGHALCALAIHPGNSATTPSSQ